MISCGGNKHFWAGSRYLGSRVGEPLFYNILGIVVLLSALCLILSGITHRSEADTWGEINLRLRKVFWRW